MFAVGGASGSHNVLSKLKFRYSFESVRFDNVVLVRAFASVSYSLQFTVHVHICVLRMKFFVPPVSCQRNEGMQLVKLSFCHFPL